MAMALVSKGGKFEIGEDKWQCGDFTVRGKCFVGPGSPRTVRAFCEQQMLVHLDRTFLVYNGERYTYGEVRSRMAALGNELVSVYGVKKGDRIALSMRNYPEWVITFLTAISLGTVVVPVNSWWKEKEMEYGLTDSGAKVLICDQERLDYSVPCLEKLKIKAIAVRPTKPLPKGVALWQDVLNDGKGKGPLPDLGAEHDDYASIMYTSGTTGNPKGVVQTNRNIVNQLTMALLADEMKKIAQPNKAPPKYQQCAIAPVPFFHVTGSHHILLSSLVTGAKLVLMFKWDAGEALKLIEQERATTWTGVPTMIQDLMEHPDFEKTDTSSLKRIGGGGAPMPKSMAKDANKKFQGAAPSLGYGLTETNGGFCVISGEDFLKRPTSTGKPYPIMDVLVVDPDTYDPLPTGEKGELVVRGPLIMREYYNKPEKTAGDIIAVKGQGGGWFRSGDAARLDEEGYVYIMDRFKDIIIRGGENISCAEVEAAFYEHDGVLECASFGIKDARLGEVVGLMFVPKKGVSVPSVQELLQSVRGKLAGFKIPKAEHVFMTKGPEDLLPRGATGKILKREVREKINAKLASQKGSKL